MKRVIFYIVFVLFLAPGAVFAKPALWKVESDNGVLYMMGTMHRLPRDAEWFDPSLKLLLLDSDDLILEVENNKATNDYLALLTHREGIGLGRKQLREKVDYDTYKEIQRQLAGFGLDNDALNPFRPWLASVFLSQLGAEASGFQFSFGAESQLEFFARQNAIPVKGLETAAKQFMFFAKLPSKTQIDMLEQTLTAGKDFKGYFNGLFDAWIAGDLTATQKLVVEPLMENKILYNVLVKSRNRAWEKDFEDMLKKGGRHFVAVGTAHLIGPDSVLKMLERKGFSVTRLQ